MISQNSPMYLVLERGTRNTFTYESYADALPKLDELRSALNSGTADLYVLVDEGRSNL